jgi:hypothetical protein
MEPKENADFFKNKIKNKRVKRVVWSDLRKKPCRVVSGAPTHQLNRLCLGVA